MTAAVEAILGINGHADAGFWCAGGSDGLTFESMMRDFERQDVATRRSLVEEVK